MEGLERFGFRGSNCDLSAVQIGDPEAPDMVLVHGMRDHALSLTSIAREFARDFHVVIPDLRGHGDSDNPGSYSMMQFVADLRALIEQRALENPIIMGHSLGGHISSRYAAIYSDEVNALVLMDGMGPPNHASKGALKDQQAHHVEQVRGLVNLSARRSALSGKEEAFARLTENNPMLNHDTARLIVDYGVEPHPEGGISWKWDSAVNMVWSTFSHDESEQQWTWVQCPVLIVTGDKAMEYWAIRRPGLKDRQELHDSELERRLNLFQQGQKLTISDAGHMIHYDQPDQLNQGLREFVDKLSH